MRGSKMVGCVLCRLSCLTLLVDCLRPTHAVYNACDDQVLDGMDAFEVALKATLRAHPLPVVRTGAAAAVVPAASRKPPVGSAEIAEAGKVRISWLA